MARVDRTETLIAEVSALRKAGRSLAGVERARGLLRDGSHLVVARACELLDAWAGHEAAGDLAGVFERFLSAEDPGCAVKERVAKVLCEWGSAEGKMVFERGISVVQEEPVYGGSGGPWKVDVAAGLRGWSALGLAALGHWEQVTLILPLLADAEPHARMMGARALSHGGSDAGEALLRLKVIQGDADADVTAECISCLARAWPDRSVGFLVGLVQQGGEKGESALLGLGESRSEDAWRELVAMYGESLLPERRKRVLAAMGLSRRTEALEWLANVVENESAGEAMLVIEALATRKSDVRIWGRLRGAAEASGNTRVVEAFRRATEAPAPAPLVARKRED